MAVLPILVAVAYTGSIDASVVDSIHYRSSHRDEIIEVYFASSSSEDDRIDVKVEIRNSDQYDREFPVVIKDTTSGYEAWQWHIVDNLVMVNFKSTSVSAAEIDRFKLDYNLSTFHEPDAALPAGGNYTYIFEVNDPLEGIYSTSVTVATDAYEEDSALIKYIRPNLLRPHWFERPIWPSGSSTVTGEAESSCPTDDPLFSDLWHVENTGGYASIFSSPPGLTSTSDADADICECWEQGYTGDNIRVAIIAQGPFGFTSTGTNPPDVASQNVGHPVSNCISNPCIALINPNATIIPPDQEGSYINGVLSALRNNNMGGAGVAPDVEVFGIYVDYADEQTIIRAFQRALAPVTTGGDDYIDIVITPYSTYIDFAPLELEVNNHVEFGRPFPPASPVSSLGTVLILSVGSVASFSPVSATTGVDVFPAGYDEVIGVIGSNPEDELETQNDGWGNFVDQYGANSGAQFDVAAPGTEVIGAYQGANNNFYLSDPDPNNGSVAIVGGIAALMLEKNNSQSWDQIRDGIRQSAEKVTYTYNADGVSPEFAYGRVNCQDALDRVTITTLESADWQPALLEIQTTSGGNVTVLYQDLHLASRSLTASVINMKGQEVALFTYAIETNAGDWQFSLPQLPSGIYSILIQDDTRSIFAVGKILKQ